MENETIRVCFCTPEPDFAEVVGRALGTEFELRPDCCDAAAAASVWEEGYDCVLLDLRDLPTGAEEEFAVRQFEKFRRTDLGPPIVVMLGRRSRLDAPISGGGRVRCSRQPPGHW